MMKKLHLIFVGLLMYSTVASQEITLISNGHSPYHIIIPEEATVLEIQAAKILQDYLYRIAGVILPVGADSDDVKTSEILIGNISREGLKSVPYDILGDDGLLIKTIGSKLILTGGSKKGVLYSVYTFLDKYLGCRKYAADVTYVPSMAVVSIPAIDDQQLPAFKFREAYYNEVYDPEYMDWHKLHSFEGNGGDESKWGYWVHTFHNLLDPAEYGETHPEYFSFYDGKRHAGMIPSWDKSGYQPEAQLCLSNPDVLEIVCENLKLAIEKRPEALYWSVSQNDNVNYCRCEKCAELDKKHAAFAPEEKMISTHGGEQYPALGMGSLLTFINKVAEQFPDKIISTLAYQYTRVPPKGIAPRSNVNIMLCSIESSRNDPMEIGDKAFSEDLIGWAKLTDNILVWDYVIRFSNLLAPFPNLKVLQPNLQFLNKNGVSAVFEQGNRDKGGEFAPLRAYLLSRMLWNPNIDIERETDDFLNGYYGAAASDIKAFIHLLHANNQSGKGVKMSVFGSPLDDKSTFLSETMIAQYQEIFDRALLKVEGSPETYERVKSARLPLYYAILEIAKSEKIGKRGAFVLDPYNQLIPKPEIIELLYEFVYHCIRTDVSRITEWHTTPKEYLEEYLAFLRQPDGR